MADFTEELEPLFDYSRVQPLNPISLDDDDEPDSSPPGKKRKKATDSAVEKVDEKVNVAVIEDDEEDWLIPPPKVTRTLGDDSILKALRLQRQELASFAESAENVVRAVEESVRQELLSSSLQTSPDAATAPHPMSQVERNKVVISIQDKDGNKQFRVFADDKLGRVFKLYADKIKLDIQSLVFRFDGDKIPTEATPQDLGMEDDDIIEVHHMSNQKGVSSTKATR